MDHSFVKSVVTGAPAYRYFYFQTHFGCITGENNKESPTQIELNYIVLIMRWINCIRIFKVLSFTDHFISFSYVFWSHRRTIRGRVKITKLFKGTGQINSSCLTFQIRSIIFLSTGFLLLINHYHIHWFVSGFYYLTLKTHRKRQFRMLALFKINFSWITVNWNITHLLHLLLLHFVPVSYFWYRWFILKF